MSYSLKRTKREFTTLPVNDRRLDFVLTESEGRQQYMPLSTSSTNNLSTKIINDIADMKVNISNLVRSVSLLSTSGGGGSSTPDNATLLRISNLEQKTTGLTYSASSEIGEGLPFVQTGAVYNYNTLSQWVQTFATYTNYLITSGLYYPTSTGYQSIPLYDLLDITGPVQAQIDELKGNIGGENIGGIKIGTFEASTDTTDSLAKRLKTVQDLAISNTDRVDLLDPRGEFGYESRLDKIEDTLGVIPPAFTIEERFTAIYKQVGINQSTDLQYVLNNTFTSMVRRIISLEGIDFSHATSITNLQTASNTYKDDIKAIQDRLDKMPTLDTSSDYTPVGAIFALAVTDQFVTAHSEKNSQLLYNKYLRCDGRGVSKTVYVDLFEAIGYKYTTAQSGDEFCVPDLRESFLKGSGTWAINGSRNTGIRPFGSVQPGDPHTWQSQSVQRHKHAAKCDQATNVTNDFRIAAKRLSGNVKIEADATEVNTTTYDLTQPNCLLVTYFIRAKGLG